MKTTSLFGKNAFVLAPLAGYTDLPFRLLCREYGADLVCSEMISSHGLVYQQQKTREMIASTAAERPVSLQLFGAEPEIMGEAAAILAEQPIDIIDINMGCPVKKVIKKGAGAALMKNPALAARIIAAVRKNSPLPVSVKIRTGWNHQQKNGVEFAQMAEDSGADLVVVHARTWTDGFSGEIDREMIAGIKEAVKIPVIGNGDVFDAASAAEMFRTTGVDGIMLARGALGRPWIFSEILQELTGGGSFIAPEVPQRMGILRKHYELEVEMYGEEAALSRMKKHFVWYTKGLPHTARLRDAIFRAKSFAGVNGIFNDYVAQADRYRGRKLTAKEAGER